MAKHTLNALNIRPVWIGLTERRSAIHRLRFANRIGNSRGIAGRC